MSSSSRKASRSLCVSRPCQKRKQRGWRAVQEAGYAIGAVQRRGTQSVRVGLADAAQTAGQSRVAGMEREVSCLEHVVEQIEPLRRLQT